MLPAVSQQMAGIPENPPQVKCPHCGTPLPWSAASPYKPFCSERCRLIDLGDWLLEKHAIPGGMQALDQDDRDP
jgi:uncharacterized protein